MKIPEIPKKIRRKTIENAAGFKEFYDQLQYFMGYNNFSIIEIQSVMHLMNSYYFMGSDLEI